MQRILETLRSGSRHQSWSRLSVELGETYNRIEARLNAPDSFRFSLSGMALGNWPRAFENVVRLETQRSLLIAAIALRRYQIRYGRLPPDLDSLAPEFLAAVPVDYMNGQPLHYRVEPDGSFASIPWDWTARTMAARWRQSSTRFAMENLYRSFRRARCCLAATCFFGNRDRQRRA